MDISFDFSGRTAIVTGAARGIGHEIATTLRSAGARIAVLDRDKALLADAWGPKTDTVLPVVVDVADEAEIIAAVEQVVEWSGRIDIAVNNAGIARDAVIWKLASQDWHQVIDVHLHGAFYLTRAVVPTMRTAGYGRIINISSYTGLHGAISQSNYAAAKAGIIGFTKAVAKETARFGITVNVMVPSARTAMVEQMSQERIDAVTAMIPCGRYANHGETGAAVAFLCSAPAGYITGAVLPVDGGMSM